MPPRRVLSLAAGLSLAAPASAAAAPPWSVPEPVGPVVGSVVGVPELRFGAAGGGIASWIVASPAAHRRALAPAVVGRAPSFARTVGSVEAGPFPYATTRTLSVRRTRLSRTVARLGYSYGRTSGIVGAMRKLDDVRLGDAAIVDLDAAVSPNGHAVVAYVVRDPKAAGDPRRATRLLLAYRRPNSSRFSTPRTIRGTGRQTGVTVDVNQSGRLVVAYQQEELVSPGGRRVEGRVGGTADGPRGLQRLGTTLGVAQIDAVVSRTRRTTVAWATRDGGEEQNQPTQIRAAVMPASSFVFRDEQLVDRGPQGFEPAAGPLTIAADDRGRATVAYTLNGPHAADQGRTPVRTASQAPDARFGASRELTPDGIAGAVAVRGDGTVAVPYVDGARYDAPSPLRVALRARGTDAFAVELVAGDAAARVPGATWQPGGAVSVLYAQHVAQDAVRMAFALRAPGG